MRKNIVAGNWKMNTSLEEGIKLASEVVNIVNDEVNDDTGIVIVPPLTHIASVKKIAGDSGRVAVGAQNCSDQEAGAYTGETSVSMVKSAGASHVILGHSERREYFKESDELLARKLDKVLEAGLTPIFCCGEPLEIREAGTQNDFVTTQLTNSLFHLSEDDFSKVVIAYEPIWAIGTGLTASSEQAQEMHANVRKHLASKFGDELADNCTILYGGSAKPSNAKELFACPDVDGGLIGGASLKARDFVDIVKSF